MDNMERIEKIVAQLPEAERVDIVEWGDHPTFRVRGKNFIFCDGTGQHLSVKLTKEEAAAVIATDPAVEPCGYGLGRHGWISFSVGPRASAALWREIEEWIRTSYTLVAPKAAGPPRRGGRQRAGARGTQPLSGISSRSSLTAAFRSAPPSAPRGLRPARGRGTGGWAAP